mmetsp:Transcript_17411/g.43385  ORF Transcript_17411/g.43385 Transcript_17411/m.43385 type:complete len:96 (-) Transcript_17411:1774-2061(-)
MTVLPLSAFTAESTSLGPLDIVRDFGLTLFRSQFNLQVVFYLAVAAHVVEGALCYKKAVKMGSSTPVGWGLQTALLGFPSFRVLLKMEKDGGKTS